MEKGNSGNTSALYVWNGISMFWGTSFHTDPHLHNTLQLVFDMDKHFLLKDESTPWSPFGAAIIRAEHMHQLDSNGSIQLFIYLDAMSAYAKALASKYLDKSSIATLPGKALRNLSNDYFKSLLLNTDCQRLLKGCHTILDQLIEVTSVKKVDCRVKSALDFINLNSNRTFKVNEVANHVCLSESRLRHLFKSQVGQPIQNFIQWMRVVDSLNMVLSGKQISQSAIDAGFWDGAHMTRSYQGLLGILPSKVKTFKEELKIVACGKGNFHTLRTEIIDDWGDSEKEIIEI